MIHKITYETYEKPTDYMKFKQGENVIRIISSGGMVKKHGLRTGKGYVPLGDCTEEADCKHCASGNIPKTKWMWIAMLKPDNKVYLLDVGPQLGDAICQMAKEKKQDPREFDIVVTKTGEKLRTKYVARLGEVKPLTPEEIKANAAAMKLLINKYFVAKREE